MTFEDRFLANLGLIDRIAAYVCRRNHWSLEDSEEFAAEMRLKIIENDYYILRKFEGRSSFPTYLTVCVQRFAQHYRDHLWGKYRPSAEARRLGEAGIVLERLMWRDGYTFAEAVEALTTGMLPAFKLEELEAIHARLPQRVPRPVLVQDADAYAIAGGITPDSALMKRDREHRSRTMAAALDTAIEELDPESQLILRLRFWSGKHVPEIAASVGTDSRKLYKRFDRLLGLLKRALLRAGFAPAEIADLLRHGDADFGLRRFLGERNSRIGPSHIEERKPVRKDATDHDRSSSSR